MSTEVLSAFLHYRDDAISIIIFYSVQLLIMPGDATSRRPPSQTFIDSSKCIGQVCAATMKRELTSSCLTHLDSPTNGRTPVPERGTGHRAQVLAGWSSRRGRRGREECLDRAYQRTEHRVGTSLKLPGSSCSSLKARKAND